MPARETSASTAAGITWWMRYLVRGRVGVRLGVRARRG